MTTLSEASSLHLTWLLALQQQLAAVGAAVLQHDYLLLHMGSFSVVVGTAHRRLRFQWDGREFCLDVAECNCLSQSSTQLWRPVQNLRIAPPERVELVIERTCRAFVAD